MRKNTFTFEEFCKNYSVFTSDSFFNDENTAITHGYEIQRCGSWSFYNPYKLVKSFNTREEACEFANRYMYNDYCNNPNW